MHALTLTRTLLRRMLSGPAGALSALALLSAWPALLVLAPTGIISRSILPQEWFYELAFVGGTMGVLLGLAALERLAPALARSRAGGVLVSEWVALGSSGVIGAALALLPGFLLRTDAVRLTTGAPAGGFLLSLLTIATAGTAVVRLRTPTGLAPWLLASGILLAPMFLSLPVSPRSLVLLAAGFSLAAWLLDHAPTETGRAR